jgi:alkanesulfonate monooxygenase SsuD/methylene tetrahydromethanopterin reductase-like flavin-dependent oxidoreductase (luciferase family)
VKYGLYLGNQSALADPRRFAEMAAFAEASGCDGIFTWDQLVPCQQPIVDPWVQLAPPDAPHGPIWVGG